MKKKYVCSIFMKTLLFLLEVLFLFSAITELVYCNILIALTYILGFLLWVTFDYILLSIVVFCDKSINIFNKFKTTNLNYSNIIKVQIIENAHSAFLVGSTFDFIFILKDNNIYKFHVGQILKANKLKRDIQNILRLKCIKLEVKDYYKK